MNELESLIKDRLENKLTVKNLAKKYKKHTSTITKLLKENNCFKSLPKATVKLDETNIIKDYNLGLNTYQIADKYKCSTSGVDKLLNRNNIKRRTRSEAYRKYNLNHDYLENINTHSKAYILGFIAADGCVTGRDSNILSVNISDKDRCVLDFIKKELDFDGRIYELKPRKRNPNPQVLIRISSKKLCSDLIKHEVTPRKSFTLKFSKLKEEFINSYILGFLDGDGSTSTGSIVFSSASVNFLISLLEQIENSTGIIGYLKKRKSSSVWTLRYKKSIVQTIRNYLYKDCNFYLKRKYNNLIINDQLSSNT